MNRVKSLSKSGNPRKDALPICVPQTNKDVSSTSTLPVSVGAEDFIDQRQEKPMDMGRKPHEKEKTMYSSVPIADKQLPSISSIYLSNGREEKGMTYPSMERERFEMKNSYNDSSSQKINSSSQNDTDEKVQKVSPPRRKGSKDEKSERAANWMKRDTIEEKGLTYASVEREKFEMKNSCNDSSSPKMNSYPRNDTDEKVQKVSPSRRKGFKDEKSERPANLMKRDSNASDLSTTSSRQQQTTTNHNTVTSGSRLYDAESAPDVNINAVLEVRKICRIMT